MTSFGSAHLGESIDSWLRLECTVRGFAIGLQEQISYKMPYTAQELQDKLQKELEATHVVRMLQ